MTQVKFDSSALKQFVHDNELGEMQAMVKAADDELRNGTGAGAAYRDWLHLPSEYDKDEF
ncbi:MAG: glucose-6-phosphate isomerase, partial [Limosilactobacillus sp.]